MSFWKAEQLLVLATLMATRHAGVTLDDVIERFSVSKRTAQRMMRALEKQFNDADGSTDDEGRKRSGFSFDRRKRGAHCAADDGSIAVCGLESRATATGGSFDPAPDQLCCLVAGCNPGARLHSRGGKETVSIAVRLWRAKACGGCRRQSRGDDWRLAHANDV